MQFNPRNTCPELFVMEAHVRGDPYDETVESHLRECHSCNELAREIKANNDLMTEIARVGVQNKGVPVAGQSLDVKSFSIPGLRDLAPLHQGGQGIVFRAYHVATRRTVAVKVLLHGKWATSKQRARFIREAELVATLRHPHIVQLFDRGVTPDGLDYFIMGYVEGVRLDEYMAGATVASHEIDKSTSIRRPRRIARLMSETCKAVNYAHQHGVIHRDLKPGNILVDADGHPHVLDFGLAKQFAGGAPPEDRPVTITGEFMGTLLYAAPEQVRGESDLADIRTDVYALGVIMYELLAGRLPHRDTSSAAGLIESITRIEPMAPSRAAAEASSTSVKRASPSHKELDAIVLKALAKNPDQRYQSARDFGDDIDNFLTGNPVTAKADSAWYLIRKFARRHRVAASVSAVFLMMIIGFGITVSVMYARTLRQTERVRYIKEFLEDMLASAEPAAAGSEVTVRDALDEAAHWVETSLVDQPDLEASVHLIIGNTYRSIGVFDEAEAHLSESLRLRRKLNGDEHLDVAECLSGLALLSRAQGKYEEAERFAKQALAIRERLAGPRDVLVGRSLSSLGSIYGEQGKFDEAIDALNRSLEIQRFIHGERHPDVAMMLYRIAELESRRGQSDRAFQLNREALDIRRGTLTSRHPDLARSLLATGRILFQTGELVEAEGLLREALVIRRTNVDRDHWSVAEAMSALGRCLAARRQFDEAEQLLTQSVQVFDKSLSNCDPLRVETIRSLVGLLKSRDELELASDYELQIANCASEKKVSG